MRYAVAVAEERSFTRAAARCHVVQSALSHQIAALERELGVRLFARSSRRVEPTAAGERFCAAARVSIGAAERAAAEASATSAQIRGTLSVGVIPTVAELDLPRVLGTFRSAHPEVSLALRSGGSDTFIAEIAEGILDVALLGLPQGTKPAGAGVASRLLAQDRHVAVLPAGHRLASRPRVRLSDLSEETFVDFPVGGPGRVQTDQAFLTADVTRRVGFESTDLGLMLGLIREGLAVGLLPPGVLGDQQGIVAVDVVDGPERGEHLAWSAFNPSPAALAFVEIASGMPGVP